MNKNKTKPTGIPQEALDHMAVMEEFAKVMTAHAKWVEGQLKMVASQLAIIQKRLGV